MRKAIIFCIIILTIMISVPTVTCYLTPKYNESDKPKDKNTKNTSDIKEQIIMKTSELINDDYCDESIIAIISIIKNNYLCERTDKKISIKKQTIDKNSKIYKKVEKLLPKANIEIKYKGKTVFIPYSYLSAGHTKTSDNYPYLTAVASPWDCFSTDFVYEKDYACGISLNGINYLCSNGDSAKKALTYYLPEFTIK